MKLFVATNSCALASHIALEEAGAEYETVRLDLGAGDQNKPEYRAVNPKGRVPALVTERGILTENPAILLFVAQSWPEAGLAPLDDPFALARMQSFNSYLCATVHVAHAHKGRGARWADDAASLADMKRKVPETVGACFALIEAEMFEGPWVMGARYGVADGYLHAVARWMEGDGVDVAHFPQLRAHMGRMAERPAVRKALAVYEA